MRTGHITFSASILAATQLVDGSLKLEQLPVGVIIRCPTAGRGHRDHSSGAATGSELQGHESAQRVPDDVGGLKHACSIACGETP
jgi:hypothetical protein